MFFFFFSLLILYPLYTIFLSVLKGAGVPAKRAKCAPSKTGLPFSEAVDLPEDGAPQQDVDPGIQDLVAGCHSDPCHHEDPVIVYVSAQGSASEACR